MTVSGQLHASGERVFRYALSWRLDGPQRLLDTKEEYLNLLKPNDIYICRTAALTFRRYILNIYSTNIHTEYFKNAA